MAATQFISTYIHGLKRVLGLKTTFRNGAGKVIYVGLAWCQTGWSENLRNCWRPRGARSTTSRRHKRNIAAAVWVKMMVEVRAGCADWFEMTENVAVIQITTPYNQGIQKAPEHIKLGSFELHLVMTLDHTRSTFFFFFCLVRWAWLMMQSLNHPRVRNSTNYTNNQSKTTIHQLKAGNNWGCYTLNSFSIYKYLITARFGDFYEWHI